jgi:hypothetical protein
VDREPIEELKLAIFQYQLFNGRGPKDNAASDPNMPKVQAAQNNSRKVEIAFDFAPCIATNVGTAMDALLARLVALLPDVL